GPKEWVNITLHPEIEPGLVFPKILNQNPNKSTKVKAIIINAGPEAGGSGAEGGESPPSEWHYQEIGGEFLGKPGVTRPTATNVNIFARGLDGNLWQAWTTGSGWN